jgi:two-component system phosphate regulon sensor histidine kinase PhoR
MDGLIIYFGLVDFIALALLAVISALLGGFLLSRWLSRRALRAYLTEFLETLPYGGVIVRHNGKIVAANAEALSLWGEAVRSLRVTGPLAAIVQEVKEQDAACTQSLDAPSGLKLQVKATPLRSSSIPYVLLTFEDITAKRYREAFYRNFISNISHELKTPLTVIQGHISTVGEALPGDDPRQTSLCIVAQEAERLTQLVDNLLLLSRLEMPDFALDRRMINLEAVVEDAILQLSDIAEEKEISLSLQRERRLPRIKADRARLKQVFINLLDNALKYNREGGSVTIRLSADARNVIAHVIDTGEGIPAQDLPHIFEKLYRVERRQGRYVEGSGLGLSIVQRIIEQHQGAISVESQVGEGSTFTVTLPHTEV